MLKTYESIVSEHLQVTVITKDKKKVFARFTGGVHQPKKMAKYISSDPDIIDALESSNGFNKDYKLIKTQGTPKPIEIDITSGLLDTPIEIDHSKLTGEHPDIIEVGEVTKEQPVVVPDESPIIQEGEFKIRIKNGRKEVLGITTSQVAKSYLLKNVDGLTNSKVKNKSLVLEVARANNIYFPDVEQ